MSAAERITTVAIPGIAAGGITTVTVLFTGSSPGFVETAMIFELILDGTSSASSALAASSVVTPRWPGPTGMFGLTPPPPPPPPPEEPRVPVLAARRW